MHDLRDVGGTPGGLGTFLLGLAMTLVGCYLFADRVVVQSGYWRFFRSEGTSFGVTLLLLLVGIGVLFYDGKSALGRWLTSGAALLLVTGIIANLEVHYRPTTLWASLLALGLFAGGLGVVARSLRPSGRG